MVEKILSEAYVDDISCHLFRDSQINYFINAYDQKDRLKLIRTNFPQFKNANFMVESEEIEETGSSESVSAESQVNEGQQSEADEMVAESEEIEETGSSESVSAESLVDESQQSDGDEVPEELGVRYSLSEQEDLPWNHQNQKKVQVMRL